MIQWGILAAVAMGGALGSVVRFELAGAFQPAWWPGFPFGIFTVNILGGFLMGVIVAMAAEKLNMTPETRAFLTTGVLGGFTTFSTFSLDSVMLMQRGAYVQAGAYIAGSVILSIAALLLGLWLVRAL